MGDAQGIHNVAILLIRPKVCQPVLSGNLGGMLFRCFLLLVTLLLLVILSVSSVSLVRRVKVAIDDDLVRRHLVSLPSVSGI